MSPQTLPLQVRKMATEIQKAKYMPWYKESKYVVTVHR
jgi:hypothetical protein